MPDELLVITPWYPNPANPYAGGFVRQSVRSVSPAFARTTILHVENRPPDDVRPPVWQETPEGMLLRVGVPIDPMTARADVVLAHREAMRTHAGDLIRDAPVIHCHVGAPTGAAAADLLAPRSRLVLTEHASYLQQVLRDPRGHDLYAAAVDRAQAFTAVSRSTAKVVENDLPSRAARLLVVPNPVPLEAFTLRVRPPQRLSRWLFVGNLVPAKGCRRLIRAFAAWHAGGGGDLGGPPARLTVVGSGVQGEELVALAAELGIADRVHLTGPVEAERIGAVYHEHDVLVHLSHRETFGLTCVEAAATGMPVLVTDCGGPQETLAVHAALGLAETVPVGDETSTADVLAGMRRLAAGVAAATPGDLVASRRHLERCYGCGPVGVRLQGLLLGAGGGSGPPAAVSEPDGGVRVLGVAVIPRHVRAVERSLRDVAALGGSGVYLTTQPVRAVLPDSIEVIDISATERRSIPSRLERAVVLRVPGLALRLARRLVEVVGVAGVGGPGSAAAQRVAAVQQRHRLLARRFRWGPYARFWRVVGPWYVARRLESDGTLAALDLDAFDGLVVADDYMVPVASRVLRIRPELEVHRRWTPQTIARRYAERSRRSRGEPPTSATV